MHKNISLNKLSFKGLVFIKIMINLFSIIINLIRTTGKVLTNYGNIMLQSFIKFIELLDKLLLYEDLPKSLNYNTIIMIGLIKMFVLKI